ncbi:MAG: hypothetical protein AAF492_31980, partial [Verrucomicrobiota bacterium]
KVKTLIEEDGEDMLKAIKAMDKFSDFAKSRSDYSAASKRHLAVDKEWAIYKRFLRTAENVVLEVNLPHVADDDIQERFATLQGLELGFFETEEDSDPEEKEGE